MSDPVTNAEVEDVLSSIRRLVSEDKRPMQAPRTVAPSERLVLTPALRVMENVAEAPPRPPAPSLDSLITDDTPVDVYGDTARENILAPDADDHEETESRAPEDDYSTDPYGFAEDEARAEEADDAHLLKSFDLSEAQEAEETAGEDQGGQEPPDALQQLVQDAIAREIRQVDTTEAPEDAADATEDTADLMAMPDVADTVDVADTIDVAEEQTTTVAEPPRDAKAVALSTKIAALETAIGKIAGTWEPDDPGDSAYAGTEPETMEWEDDEPSEDEIEIPAFAHRYGVSVDDDEPAEEEEPAHDEAEVAMAEPVETLEDDDDPTPVARLGTLRLETRADDASDPVEDMDRETAEAQRIEAFRPAAEVEEDPIVLTPPLRQSAQAEPRGIDLSSEEQILDEEMLRDLVSEIVRQELQGAPGERITRNVRKLVRREIHRALTAQELE